MIYGLDLKQQQQKVDFEGNYKCYPFPGWNYLMKDW